MPATQYNLLVEQGATLTATLTVTNSDGTPFNLTGYTAAGKIRAGYTDDTALVSLTFAIPSPATGVITLSLTAAQTAALPVTRGVYDVTITSGSTALRILQGSVTISPTASA